FDFHSLPAQLNLAYFNPRAFFETTLFTGTTRDSIVMLVLTGFIIGLLNIVHSGLLAPLLFPIFWVAGYLVISGLVSTLFRDFLVIEAGFPELLRFSAYQSIVALPVFLAGALIPPFAPLLHLGFFVWSVFGFYVAFRPRLGRLIALSVAPTILFFVAWIGLIGMIIQARDAKLGSGIAEYGSRNAGPPSPAPIGGAVEGTRVHQVVQPHQVIAQKPAHEARASGDEHGNPFVGEFRPGEVYQYWIQLSGLRFKREAEMEIRVKTADSEGATLEVKGGFDKTQTNFTMKVSWEMDFTAPVTFDLQTAGVNHIVNLLLSHRVRLSLMGTTPASKLPEALRTGRRMKVAGLKGLYFQNWGPSRSVADVREVFDIAVSKDHGLPIFLQGRNDVTNGRIYITLKNYSLPAGL
ncbi:MAG TPA: Yip1 family protein, partial [Bdellovibrionales bacterium]|nr:Yip1 family protein [Bdellovibrionales bacterium]